MIGYQEPRKHSYRLPDVFKIRSNTKGEVGLELETIGVGIPTVEFKKTKLWTCKADHSIKVRSGEVGVEYVLTQPLARGNVPKALEELIAEFAAIGGEVKEGRISNSTHVHINAQSLTMQQIYTWLTLYFIFEEVLVRWCGEARVGNLFCLRAKDAEGLIFMLHNAAKKDDFSQFRSDHFRYAAVNVMALTKFGSLEFRSLRGTADKDVIQTWVDTLLMIKDQSLNFKNPPEVLSTFSQRMPLSFAIQNLPVSMRAFAFEQPDFESILFEGARMAQNFAFATKWQDNPMPLQEAPAKIKPDPGTVYTNSLAGTSFTNMQVSPPAWSGNHDIEGVMPATAAPGSAPLSHILTWNVYKDLDGRLMRPTGLQMSNGTAITIQLSPIVNELWSTSMYKIDFARLSPGRYRLAVLNRANGAIADWIGSNLIV